MEDRLAEEETKRTVKSVEDNVHSGGRTSKIIVSAFLNESEAERMDSVSWAKPTSLFPPPHSSSL